MNGGQILKPFDVIRTEDVSANFKDGKPIVLIENFTLIRDDITKMIGNPINYSDWELTKKNPNGDNALPPRKPKNTNMPQQQGAKQHQGSNLSNSVPHSKPLTNQGPPKNNFPPQPANNQSNSNSNTTSNNFQNKNQQPSKPMQNHGVNMPQQNTNQFNQPKQNPPQQQNSRSVPQLKAQVDRHDRSYTMIKELYEGI